MVLPAQLFGIDIDDVFAYTTTKKVRIRDRNVGLLYYSFMVLIVAWVIGWQILHNNDHFKRKDVVGMARMLYSHPTKNNCDGNLADCQSDFIPIENLPYCREFKGQPWEGDRHCKYADLVTAVPGGEVDNKLFVPTSVEIITQRLVNGQYVSEKGSDCLHDGYMCHKRAGQDNQFFYVADVKSFTIQFTSSYDRGGIVGTSLENPGSYWECSEKVSNGSTNKWSSRLRDKERCSGYLIRKDIPCLEGLDCEGLQKFDVFKSTGLKDASDAANEGPGLFKARGFLPSGTGVGKQIDDLEDKKNEMEESVTGLVAGKKTAGRIPGNALLMETEEHADGDRLIGAAKVGAKVGFRYPGQGGDGLLQYQNKWGDVFKVGRLIELAGADLDNDYNIDGWTSRQSGTAIEISCEYENLHPWLSSFGYKPVKYAYKVKELNMPYVSRVQLSDLQPDDYPLSRRYEVKRGVLVLFRISGVFGIFDVTFLLIMLTTAFALIAAANSLTDFVATYLVEWGSNFFHLKYDVSPDFSDMWRCATCGYHNLKWDEVCKGVPAWECMQEHTPCGAAKPVEAA